MKPPLHSFSADLRPGKHTPRCGANGRQAPVKRCLARFADLKPQLHCASAMKRADTKNEKLEAVRHHLPDGVDVGLVDFGQLLEFAHALGSLGA